MTSENPHCADCHFWERVRDEDGQDLGICRRFPPNYDGWPMTEPAQWCGEFTSKVADRGG